MGRIIAIANQKGGVGKTTTAINLSACLAEAGKHVLMLDCDPQGNATSGLGVDKNKAEVTSYDILIGEATAEEAIVHTEYQGLDIIPSNINLSGVEIELIVIDHKVYILQKHIYPLNDKYDFIIIDCPT